MRIFLPINFIVALVLALGAAAQVDHAHQAPADQPPGAPLLEGLGDHRHPVTTQNDQAQRFFDQGLALLYGFNHLEAHRSFTEAARLDPDCAMAYWGQAIALGPNINMPMSEEHARQAYAAIQQALQRRDNASETERAYIEALATRYTAEPPEDRAPLDKAYADAMTRLAAQYPEDDDAAVLCADALMNLSPWYYWHPDGYPRPDTPQVLALLEKVIARSPRHAGAHHFYIHATEASQRPELGEPSADVLGSLMPGAGHLVHMPSHVYIRVGRYADAVDANLRAIDADEGYITQCRMQGLYPVAYYPHNIHFLMLAATMDGRARMAIDAARKVADTSSTHGGYHGAIFEVFRVPPFYTLVRFGRWDDILAEPKPPEDLVFTNGIWHYARGCAFRGKDMLEEARAELAAVEAAAKDPALKDLPWMHMPPRILQIAQETLAGEIEASEQKYDSAIDHLETAVRLQDGLPYNEPPDWHYPVRHSLGAVLLEAGRPNEAETVYWNDLTRNPHNGWALFGLLQAIKAQGPERARDAEEVQARFNKAWARSDVKLTASRF